jgi:ATP-dependent Clp endopeptidase proteolytic subunit ClpP
MADAEKEPKEPRDEAAIARDEAATAKLKVETQQIEQAMAANAVRQDAEIAKLRAEERVTLATAQRSESEAKVAELQAKATAQSEAWRLADNRFNHMYVFTEAVGAQSVAKCINQLDIWSRLDPTCSITIVFNSPGGSVIDGMSLFDYITQLQDAGHHITTRAMGYAASMAGILLQAGNTRQMGREAYILVHEISTVTGGTMGQIEDEVEFLKKIQKRIVAIFAKRSKLSAKEIEKRWKRTDWWIDSDDALKLGIVDEVL